MGTIQIARPSAPATTAQLAYAASLYNRAYPYTEGDENYAEAANAFHEITAGMNKGDVSTVIDNLKAKIAGDAVVAAAEKITQAEAAPVPVLEITAGMYRLADGTIVKAQKARQGSHLYGKVLTKIGGHRLTENDLDVRFDFVYTPGILHRVTAADRMTLDEAVAFGIQYGICCNCGATLKDSTSVAAGIGPVCAKKFA